MLPIRFVRMTVAAVLIGLVGFVLGCSGESGTAKVPTKEESKKIAEEMKSAQKERMKAMRSKGQAR